MTRLERIHELLPLFYPSFYTVRTYRSEYEFVLLDYGDHKLPRMFSKKRSELIEANYSDKTEFEGFNNHVHIFDGVNVSCFRYAVEIGKSIAKNLLRALKSEYPQKTFVVLLSAHCKNGVIVRFHQAWDNEPPYYDINGTYYGNPEMYEFRG